MCIHIHTYTYTFVCDEKNVWKLQQVPIPKQIDNYVQSLQFEDAHYLINSRLENGNEKALKLKEVKE